MDEDLLEECLIPLPTVGRHRVLVCARAVGKALEAKLDQVFRGIESHTAESDLRLGCIDFAVDPLLLTLQHLDRDGVGVVGTKELVALGGELDEASAGALGALAAILLASGDFKLEVSFDVAPDLGGNLNASVESLDLRFDWAGWRVKLCALRPTAVLAEAEEVLVLMSLPVRLQEAR